MFSINEKYVLHMEHSFKNKNNFEAEIELKYSKPKTDKDSKFHQVLDILDEYLKSRKLEDKYFRAIDKRLDIVATAMDIKVISSAFEYIFNMFEEDDLIQFVVEKGYKPPSSLPEKFSVTDSIIGKSDYERTYTQDQYLGLVALSIPIKAVMPLYSKIFESGNFLTDKKLTPLILYHAYDKTLSYFDIAQRLETYVDGHMNGKDLSNEKKKKEAADELNISSDRLFDYLVADSLITIMFSTIEKSGKGTNLASKIYSRLRKYLDYGISSSPTKERSNNAGKEGEDGSTIEVLKSLTSRSIGEIEEFRFAVHNLDYLCHQLNLNRRIIDDIIEELQILQDKSIRIQKHTFLFVNWVLSTILPPDAIQYLDLDVVKYVGSKDNRNRDGFINALAATYLYIKDVSDELAALVASKSSDEILLASTIRQIDKDVQDKLQDLYYGSLLDPIDYVNTITNDNLKGVTITPLLAKDRLQFGEVMTASSKIKTDVAKLLLKLAS